MKHTNKSHMPKELFVTVKDWIMDHTKIVMPIVLVVCVLITVFVAVSANQKKNITEEAQTIATAVAQETSTPEINQEEISYALEENAYQDVNSVIKNYYTAQAEGDMETISALNTYLNDIEKIRVEEMSKYIESYPSINVYTKPGLTENSFVAYVYSEVKFEDATKNLPGMQTYYIEKGEDGKLTLSDGTYDDEVWNYIKEVTLQDDVVDLNNKVVVEYNELLAGDEELNEFIAYLKEKINEDVGEILAEAESPVEEPIEVAEAEPEAEAEEAPEIVIIQKVRTTDVVNIRSSDSETADKLDKAQVGQEFTLIEEKGNGWSKIDYKGKEAYIKSDYLELVSEEEASASETVSGTVTVLENVRVRSGANTNSEILGTAYTGEKLDLIMKQADGWTKVKYKGETAYVKSDYVE
ncbi:MAG: SH3 domain-containing protein [Lachnospiraceae bacterium]|nr:SH3 domain-containing protein [Lachnospiraceae bacterium]